MRREGRSIGCDRLPGVAQLRGQLPGPMTFGWRNLQGVGEGKRAGLPLAGLFLEGAFGEQSGEKIGIDSQGRLDGLPLHVQVAHLTCGHCDGQRDHGIGRGDLAGRRKPFKRERKVVPLEGMDAEAEKGLVVSGRASKHPIPACFCLGPGPSARGDSGGLHQGGQGLGHRGSPLNLDRVPEPITSQQKSGGPRPAASLNF